MILTITPSNDNIQIIQDILNVPISEPASIKDLLKTGETTEAYNTNEADEFLLQIVTEYAERIRQIPTSPEDETAFDEALARMISIQQKGRDLLEFAKKIRQNLLSWSGFAKGVADGEKTKPRNDEIEHELVSFRNSTDPLLNSIPPIEGIRSYLLASLYQKYLVMSSKTYVLDDKGDAMEKLPGSMKIFGTTEGAGKFKFGIDCDVRRQTVANRSERLQKELKSKKDYLPEPIKSQFDDELDLAESIDVLIKELQTLIDKYITANEGLKIIQTGFERRLKFFLFIEDELTKNNDLFLSGNIQEWFNYFSKYCTPHTIKEFSDIWAEFVSDIKSVPAPVEETTTAVFTKVGRFLFPFLFQTEQPNNQTESTPTVKEQFLAKITREKKEIKEQLEILNQSILQQQLLIKKLAEIKSSLNRPWYLFKKEKVNKLNNLIISLSANISDFHGENLNITITRVRDILKTERLFTASKKRVDEFNEWHTNVLSLYDTPAAKTWLESKKASTPLFSGSFSFSSFLGGKKQETVVENGVVENRHRANSLLQQ